MKVVVLHNPTSGRARAAELSASLEAALQTEGFQVDSVSTADTTQLDARLAGASAFVIVGGDGTVNHALEVCERTKVPVYHFPTGNENLFARACRHHAVLPRVVASIRRGATRSIDVGLLANVSDLSRVRRFAIMVTIGPDASVIHRLGAVRTNSRGHLVYVRPILDELWDAIRHPKPPVLRVWVDGKKIADDGGWLVVANSRQYALRIDPARHADMADGLLEVVFLPASTSLGLLARVVGARLRWPGPGVIRGRGGRIRVRAEGLALCAQIDGEAGPAAAAGGLDLDFGVEQASLRVLMGG